MLLDQLSQVKQAKYIKLGEKGKWEQLCFADGTLRLAYYEVPSLVEPDKYRDVVYDLYLKLGKTKATASSHARQIIDFYNAGPETLWITFSQGKLWWCQTQKDVEFLGNTHENGSRLKRTLSGWHSCSLGNKELFMHDLSGKLTRSANYQQTICAIQNDAFKYLMNKIRDEDIPQIAEMKLAREKMYALTQNLIQLLTWQDFELFVDILFSTSGWRRVTALGGQKKTTDIELISPLTNEIAYVQIKSETTQQEFDRYVEEFKMMPANRFFYVYHSSNTGISCDDEKIKEIGMAQLAEGAFRSGLIDWLIEKVG